MQLPSEGFEPSAWAQQIMAITGGYGDVFRENPETDGGNARRPTGRYLFSGGGPKVTEVYQSEPLGKMEDSANIGSEEETSSQSVTDNSGEEAARYAM